MMAHPGSLRWGALTAGVMCLGWALLTLVPFLLPVIVLLGIAAFVLLLIAVRHVHGAARAPLAAGATLGLIPLALWTLLFAVSLPIKFGRNPDSGRVSGGMQGLQDLALALGGPLMALTAAALVLAFFALWTQRERVLAISGLVVIVLVQLVTPLLDVTSQALGTAFTLLFALGFVAVAAACLYPLRRGAEAGSAFHRAAPPPKYT